MLPTIALSIILGLSLGTGIFVYALTKAHRKKLLEPRQDMPLDQIYLRYFQDLPKEQVIHAWRQVAASLSVSPLKLRFSDKLDDLRGPDDIFDSDVDDLIDLVPRDNLNDTEYEFKSVGELVRFIVQSRQREERKL